MSARRQSFRVALPPPAGWKPYAWHTRLGRWMAHSVWRTAIPLAAAALAGAALGAIIT